MSGRESYSRRLFRTMFNSRLRLTSKRALKLEQRVAELESELGEMSLLCLSLMTILTDSGIIDERDLDLIMEQIDASDGVIDGRLSLRDRARFVRENLRKPRDRS